MKSGRSFKRLFGLVVVIVPVLLAYQNCSAPSNDSPNLALSAKQGSDTESGSGSGFDGKLYVHRGSCSNPYEVDTRIGIDSKSGLVSYITKECSKLSQPEVIPAAAVSLFDQILIRDRKIFDYELTDEELALGKAQKITTRFCNHTGIYKKKPFHFVNSVYTYEDAKQVLIGEISDQVVNVVLQMLEQLAPPSLVSESMKKILNFVVQSIADLFMKILDPRVSVSRPVESPHDPNIEIYKFSFSPPDSTDDSVYFAQMTMNIHRETGLGSMEVSINMNILPPVITGWFPLVKATIPEGGIVNAVIKMDCYTDNLGASSLGGLPDPNVRPYIDSQGREYFAWRVNRSCSKVCESSYIHEKYEGKNVNVVGECDREGTDEVSGPGGAEKCGQVLESLGLGTGGLNAEGVDLAAPGCSVNLGMKRHHSTALLDNISSQDSCGGSGSGFIRVCACRRVPLN